MSTQDFISVNARSSGLITQLIRDASELRLNCHTHSNGGTVVDAGVECLGGIEAGRRIAEICLAGLGRVSVVPVLSEPHWPWHLCVTTSQPVLACMASQYAGWSLAVDADGQRYSAMASGAGRALALKEPLFAELNYKDSHDSACLVLESDQLPPSALIDKVADECHVEARNVTLVVTPTGSLAGATQIAARVVEVALHKSHELGFPLDNIVDATGSTPLPPPARDFITAMGRTNDTILFGGRVQLYVSGAQDAARELAMALPSNTSSDYGKPFAEVFAACNHDFFKIDGKLFSPAQVSVTALETGATFYSGSTSAELLDRSFGGSEV